MPALIEMMPDPLVSNSYWWRKPRCIDLYEHDTRFVHAFPWQLRVLTVALMDFLGKSCTLFEELPFSLS